MSKRECAVAGSFYPDQCVKIEQYFSEFDRMLNIEAFEKFQEIPRALIVPHAGYMYSGFTANVAFKIASKRQDIKRIVVIGPSHRVSFLGASVAQFESYESPCGDLKIDTQYSKTIEAKYDDLVFMSHVHHEHSTEVMMPFIGHYFNSTPVVEIVYGRIDPKMLALIIEDIMSDKENFLVISTDLSHFYNLDEANRLDGICIEAIESMNVSMLDTGCEACGMLGVKGALLAAKAQGLKTQIVDYRTSADASGDKSRETTYES
jgi:AmmeMemoRadiSam system protein B